VLWCASAGFRLPPSSAAEREAAVQMVASTALEGGPRLALSAGRGAPEKPIAGVSRDRSNALIFHYSRLFAVGLLSLLPTSPRGRQPGAPSAAGTSRPRAQPPIGPAQERVDKDLSPLRRQSREKDWPKP